MNKKILIPILAIGGIFVIYFLSKKLTEDNTDKNNSESREDNTDENNSESREDRLKRMTPEEIAKSAEEQKKRRLGILN
jgi:predicted DNA repair protein MutK